MLKSSLLVSIAVSLTACSTMSENDTYANWACEDLRALVSSQDFAASVRGVEIYNDRGAEETRFESGSPWAGRSKTRDGAELKEERQAIREAYKRKNCKA